MTAAATFRKKYTSYTSIVYAVYMPATLTAQKIATAARRLLDREGAEAVTTRRVAEAVGITPMAVYRHYPDRAGFLNALANDCFEELARRLATKRFSVDIERRLTKMADIYLEHARENPRLFELMFLKRREGATRGTSNWKIRRLPTSWRM